MSNTLLIRVAVVAPLPGTFDYLPPAGLAPERLLPGARVLVPFGRSQRLGWVLGLVPLAEAPALTLKPIIALLDEVPLLGAEELALLRWAADYYQHPPGEVLLAGLPARLRSGAARPPAGPVGWRLTPAGQQVDPASLSRAPRQAALLGWLRERPDGAEQTALRAALGESAQGLRRLAERGWIAPCALSVARSPDRPGAMQPGPPLNEDQRQAVTAVMAGLGRFSPFLLDGITGSGKTEVYLSLIEAVLARGDQVLVLVPEIGLTPQLQQRLARRIAAPVALLHSALSDGERERGWWAAREGRAAVVLGTRSAVFAPLPRLALILVDEEHDLSFKQQEGFRYSARDLAVRRAQRQGCPVLLGSATPSLESLRNAASGRYQWLHLRERAGGAQSPRVDLIDLRGGRPRGGLSPILIQLLGETLAADQQALLFLNRRGYAPLLTCHACGWVADCPHCDARLTLHRETALLWCHHCGFQQPPLVRCPDCQGSDLRALGQGTERLEEVLGELFPGVGLARIDRDSTRRRGSLARLLEDARMGRFPLLLGTQMLAKGHHFPNVTLVGILDVDRGLYGADYRDPERMAQLIVQVAGRAGRADKPGRVLIQTRHPDHPLLQTLIHRGYAAFAHLALEERRAAGLPPFSAQALIRAESATTDPPRAFLEAALAAANPLPQDISLWGPVPAPMARRAGHHRAHLLIQGGERMRLQAFLARWVPNLYRLKEAHRVRWSLDVDPQELL